MRELDDHPHQAKELNCLFTNSKLKITAIITARGNSKRIPRKNLVELDGHPLIAWTIASAKLSKLITSVFVSTDSDEIKRVSENYNCEVLGRPDELSGDYTTSDQVLEYIFRHQIKKLRPSHFVVLQPTSPLREIGFLDRSIETFLNSKNFNKAIEVLKFNANFASIVNNELVFPGIARTQDLEDLFYPSGRIFILDLDEIFNKGKSIKTLPIMGPHYQENVNVDNLEDIEIMKMLYEAKKRDYLYLKEYLDAGRRSHL